MATKGAYAMTMAEWANRLDPDGNTAQIVEVLAETNPILAHIPFVEGNLPTGHRTTVRSGLPTVTWRQLNYGVQPSKSRTVPVTDVCGMLEAYSEIDKEIADLNGNTAAFRLSEDSSFLEAMAIEHSDTLFYGNTETDPEKFMGLAPRYDDLTATNATNMVAGGGTGDDNASLWFISWGPRTVHGIFPQGSKSGIHSQNLGEVTLQDAQSPSGLYQGYRTHFQLKTGLCVRDWRYASRIYNIDVSDLAGDSAANLLNLSIDAKNKIPSQGWKNIKAYCSPTVYSALEKQSLNKSNLALTMAQLENGRMELRLHGFPIYKVDSLIETETLIS